MRGEEYFRQGLVRITSASPDHIIADVKGSHLYQTSLEWNYDSDDIDLELICACTCPAYENYEEPCKHVWALMLTADAKNKLYPSFYRELDFLESNTKAELISHFELPFLVHYQSARYQDHLIKNASIEENDDLSPDDTQIREPWEQELNSLERYMVEAKEEELYFKSKSPINIAKLWYEVETYSGIQITSNYKYLNISLHESSILKNGKIGKLKTKSFQDQMLENKRYKEDEKYLHLLRGHFDSGYYGPKNEAMIPSSLAKLLIKELSKSE